VFKKAGVVAAAAAGLLMLGGPAFAGEGHGHDDHVNNTTNGQLGLVNLNDIDILKDINVNVPIGVCNNNIGVLAVIVPVLSPQGAGSCSSGAIID
jgi:hypothetical protein